MASKKNENIELLREFSNAFGVTGFEDDVKELVKKHLKDICTFDGDRVNSIICRHKTKNGAAVKNIKKIAIFTHTDEVGFMVRGIMQSGFIKFIGLGGWSPQTLPSQRVMIKAADGKLVPGVIGMKSPHLLTDDERSKVPKIDSMYIDVGASSADEVINRLKIDLGCPIVPYSEFMELNSPNVLSGKAFDNRAGLASMVAIMKKAENLNKNLEIIGVGSSLEESGLRGARTSATRINPDVAIVIDTPPADDTPNNETAYPAQGKLGNGPQVRLYDPTMIANPKLIKFIRETAAGEKLNLQYAVRSSGGTDAGSVHLVHSGVPTVVLGIPTRYIHGHVGIIKASDIEDTIKLTLSLIKKMTPEIIESF